MLFYQRVGLLSKCVSTRSTNGCYSTNGLYQPYSCQPTINHVPTQPSTWLTSLYTCLPNHQPLPSRDILSSVQGVHIVSSHRYANQPELLSSTSKYFVYNSMISTMVQQLYSISPPTDAIKLNC